MPTTKESIEWVKQHHYEHPHDATCVRCGGMWPCVPTILVEELEDAWVDVERLCACGTAHYCEAEVTLRARRVNEIIELFFRGSSHVQAGKDLIAQIEAG
jgi:hypothetical protein